MFDNSRTQLDHNFRVNTLIRWMINEPNVSDVGWRRAIAATFGIIDDEANAILREARSAYRSLVKQQMEFPVID